MKSTGLKFEMLVTIYTTSPHNRLLTISKSISKGSKISDIWSLWWMPCFRQEKQYHNMLENIAGNTSSLIGFFGCRVNLLPSNHIIPQHFANIQHQESFFKTQGLKPKKNYGSLNLERGLLWVVL